MVIWLNLQSFPIKMHTNVMLKIKYYSKTRRTGEGHCLHLQFINCRLSKRIGNILLDSMIQKWKMATCSVTTSSFTYWKPSWTVHTTPAVSTTHAETCHYIRVVGTAPRHGAHTNETVSDPIVFPSWAVLKWVMVLADMAQCTLILLDLKPSSCWLSGSYITAVD